MVPPPGPPSGPGSGPIVRRRTDRRSLRRRDGLLRHARDVTSQGGEDGIVARLFELLPPPARRRRRWCVDVGAWDGVHLSNTHALLVGDRTDGDDADDDADADGDADDGNGATCWSGVLIEADRGRFEDLKRLHGPRGNVCVRAAVSCRPASPDSLTSILGREAPDLPRDFDFLSIDVDGIDYWILADVLGVSDEEGRNGDDGSSRVRGYRPKVVCVEFNPTMPIDLIYVPPRDDSVRHGSSLSAMVELATEAGYALVETTLFNAFFVPTELHERYLKEEVPDTSIEALHEVAMGTKLYQLYDGTVKLWGCKRMLWHRMPMDEGRMQMLPAEERHFPFAPSGEGSTDGGGEEKTKSDSSKARAARDARRESDRIRETAIDVSSYCLDPDGPNDDNSDRERRECSAKLREALHDDGFALVRGTGVSAVSCSEALRAAKSFLHDADESVRRSCLTKDRARRGYSPMCTENFASLVGKAGPNDLVKKFRVGPPGSNEMDDDDEGHRRAPSSLHQPNAWPPDEVWGRENASSFRSSIEEYYEQTCRAADRILNAVCDGIVAENADISESVKVFSGSNGSGNDAGHEGGSGKHTSILTLLGYQPGSRHKKGSKGYMRPLVSAHTDVGVVTVLLFDDGKCAALQRAADASDSDPENNDWADVDLPFLERGEDPVFVVNVGDCLSELSGGALRSTLHRVVPRPCSPNASRDDAVRTCLALFVGLEPSAPLVLPSSGDVLSYEEWRRGRIARATAVLKNR